MSIKDLKIIDPRNILPEDFPVWVLSGDMRGFIGYGIRELTKSNWNHSMTMQRPGHICSQNLTYTERPIVNYMKSGIILKFYKCHDMTAEEREEILSQIETDLAKPWWGTFYDFPGIVGQLFGIRWFNIPWLNYCSERTAKLIRVIIKNLKLHPTPEDNDQALKDSKRMTCLGYWLDL